MIKQKNKHHYNLEQASSMLLKRIIDVEDKPNRAEIDAIWRVIAAINASAYKGYGCLPYEQYSYNSEVYCIKNWAIECLIPLSMDFIEFDRLRELLYVRTADGIQYSFHIRTSYQQLYEWEDTLPRAKEDAWDRVRDAYRYSAQAYARAKEKIRQKIAKEEITCFKAFLLFFRKKENRKKYDFNINYDKWIKRVLKRDYTYCPSVRDVLYFTITDILGCNYLGYKTIVRLMKDIRAFRKSLRKSISN